MTPYRVPRQVLVYVHRGGRFLLLRRIPQHGGFWQGVTGAPEPGESDLDAAVREVREETGYDVRATIRPIDFRYELRPGPDDRVDWTTLYAPGVEVVPEEVFMAEAGAEEPALSWEHAEFRWCTVDEALELLHYENNRAALARAAELLG